MVFAHRIERHVPQHHRVPVVLVKDGINGISRVQIDAREKLSIHGGDAMGSIAQPFPVGIVPNCVEDFKDRFFDALLDNGSLALNVFPERS